MKTPILKLIDSLRSRFRRFFSPLGMAPVVGLVGLGLFQRGFPAVSSNSAETLPMHK